MNDNSSRLRMIGSQHLTMEMAVNYLFQWRSDEVLVDALLTRIMEFSAHRTIHYIPSLIFVMSVEPTARMEKFFQTLASQSLPLYLMIKWSYCAYESSENQSDLIHSKLDSSLLRKPPMNEENFDVHHEMKVLKQKQRYCEFLTHMNQFFQRLFKIPLKLKKHQKSQRNQKLHGYLNKILTHFWDAEDMLMYGIPFPIEDQSYLAISILNDYCFTFSTKERVPFKIVIETVSYEDSQLIKRAKPPEEQSSSIVIGRNSLILPQSYFGEEWKEIEKRIKSMSPFGKYGSYRIRSFMVKSGDDLRQEYMAMQLIKMFEEISEKENLKLWVRSYSVIPFNKDSGLIEFVSDTRTVSYLKQKSGERSLKRIYQQLYGDQWQEAITNFIQSLAGYSLIQYLFQIKDRHNNNILVDTWGHIIHIDFSFIISSSPGNMGFERAPFKLTQDYMELMQGSQSDIFAHFRLLFFLGLKYIRKYRKQIMDMVMMMSNCPEMKCFQRFNPEHMAKRFHQNATDEELQKIVDTILKYAYGSYTTANYDRFQWFTNQIYS